MIVEFFLKGGHSFKVPLIRIKSERAQSGEGYSNLEWEEDGTHIGNHSKLQSVDPGELQAIVVHYSTWERWKNTLHLGWL